MISAQKEKAIQFRAMHNGAAPLILPNAWDAASAAVLTQAGFEAVATTSSGVAAALGYADGQRISREMLIEVVERIARVVDCPVSVDFEAGYGESIAEVLQSVRAVIEAGAVGINFEDSTKQHEKTLVDVASQVELLKAIRETALEMDVPLVINARTDVFLLAKSDASEYVDEAIRRLNAYREAGADCLFPIGVSNAEVIERLAQEVQGPINILAGPTTPSIAELGRLGVARVSFGAGLMRAALAHLRRIARELLESGTYSNMAGMLSMADFRSLVSD